MKVTCGQCGANNMLGALFCRECGAKLDLTGAEQELRRRQREFTFADARHIFGWVRRIVTWALLVFVVLVLVGLFLPVPIRVRGDLAEDHRKEAMLHFQELLSKEVYGRGAELEFRFTNEEATYLGNYVYGLKEVSDVEDVGLALFPERLSVEMLPSTYVRLVLRSRALKKMNMYSTLVGRLVPKDGRIVFVMNSAYVGKIRMVGPMKDIVRDRFKILGEDKRELDILARRIDFVEVDRGEAVITVKASEQPQRKSPR